MLYPWARHFKSILGAPQSPGRGILTNKSQKPILVYLSTVLVNHKGIYFFPGISNRRWRKRRCCFKVICLRFLWWIADEQLAWDETCFLIIHSVGHTIGALVILQTRWNAGLNHRSICFALVEHSIVSVNCFYENFLTPLQTLCTNRTSNYSSIKLSIERKINCKQKLNTDTNILAIVVFDIFERIRSAKLAFPTKQADKQYAASSLVYYYIIYRRARIMRIPRTMNISFTASAVTP